MEQFKKPVTDAIAKGKIYAEKGKVYVQRGKAYAQQHKRNTIIAALVILFIIWLLLPTGFHVPTSAPIPVTAATAVQKDMRVDLYASGTITTDNSTTVKARVDGHVIGVNFVAGQYVKAGDLLVILDTRPFEIALEQAQANLGRDKATLAFKQENLRRYTDLVKKGYVSESDFELAQSDAQAAAAIVQASQASVDNAELQLDYCYIRAPINGRAGDALIKNGNIVRANDSAIVVINQITPIRAQFALPEQYWQAMQANFQHATVEVEARSPQDNSLLDKGTLVFLDNTINSTTGSFNLKAQFPNEKQQLWPGQYVKIYLPLETVANAIVVPAQAIQESNQGPFVFVIRPDNIVQLRRITLGATVNNETIVAAGVAAEEKVVTEGQFRLSDGSVVTLKPEDTTTPPAKSP